jgi:hypothetical protein
MSGFRVPFFPGVIRQLDDTRWRHTSHGQELLIIRIRDFLGEASASKKVDVLVPIDGIGSECQGSFHDFFLGPTWW